MYLSEIIHVLVCSTVACFVCACVRKGLTSKVLKGHTSYVFCVNYNTEGTQLVSGGCEGDVRIWNAAKGACKLVVEGLVLLDR